MGPIHILNVNINGWPQKFFFEFLLLFSVREKSDRTALNTISVKEVKT